MQISADRSVSKAKIQFYFVHTHAVSRQKLGVHLNVYTGKY